MSKANRPAKIPSYLREDIPQVRWIYHPQESHFLFSGREMYEFLEENRIPKERRFPKKRRRRKKKHTKSSQDSSESANQPLLNQILGVPAHSKKEEEIRSAEGSATFPGGALSPQAGSTVFGTEGAEARAALALARHRGANPGAPPPRRGEGGGGGGGGGGRRVAFPGMGRFRAALPQQGIPVPDQAQGAFPARHPLREALALATAGHALPPAAAAKRGAPPPPRRSLPLPPGSPFFTEEEVTRQNALGQLRPMPPGGSPPASRRRPGGRGGRGPPPPATAPAPQGQQNLDQLLKEHFESRNAILPVVEVGSTDLTEMTIEIQQTFTTQLGDGNNGEEEEEGSLEETLGSLEETLGSLGLSSAAASDEELGGGGGGGRPEAGTSDPRQQRASSMGGGTVATQGSRDTAASGASTRSARSHRKIILKTLQQMGREIPMATLNELVSGNKVVPLTRVERMLDEKIEKGRSDFSWFAETCSLLAELEEKEAMAAAEEQVAARARRLANHRAAAEEGRATTARADPLLPPPSPSSPGSLRAAQARRGREAAARAEGTLRRRRERLAAHRAALAATLRRRQQMFDRGFIQAQQAGADPGPRLWLVARCHQQLAGALRRRALRHPRAHAAPLTRRLAARAAQEKVLEFYKRQAPGAPAGEHALAAALGARLLLALRRARRRRRDRAADRLRAALNHKRRLQNRCRAAFHKVREGCVRFQRAWRGFLACKAARLQALAALWEKGEAVYNRLERQRRYDQRRREESLSRSRAPSPGFSQGRGHDVAAMSSRADAFHYGFKKAKKRLARQLLEEIFWQRRQWFRQALRVYYSKNYKTSKVLPYDVGKARELVRGPAALVAQEVVRLDVIRPPFFALYSTLTPDDMAEYVAAAVAGADTGGALVVPGLPPRAAAAAAARRSLRLPAAAAAAHASLRSSAARPEGGAPPAAAAADAGDGGRRRPSAAAAAAAAIVARPRAQQRRSIAVPVPIEPPAAT